MFKHSLTIIAAFVISTSPLLLTNTAFADGQPKTNEYWWPKKLDLSPLRQPSTTSDPMGRNFNYAEQFKQLDLNAVVADLKQMLTTSQAWWPADYGNYGPFFIRMSWHAAGTYRIFDGRGGAEGGMQRFAPLNSWPDNVNLDKARRLLWPIKQKYGDKISWSDLMVLAGTVAIEQMGVHTIGFAGGRIDAWEPQEINWGTEDEWMGNDRQTKDKNLKEPYAATQMGLIYVNPEGPEGNPDPLAAAKHIRETFSRMAMNDEETVALIAGGHTFGKAHGAAPSSNLGPAPEAAPIQLQGFGWQNSYGTGSGDDTITSGLEGAWSVSPVQWSNSYFQNLFGLNWVKTKSPAGAIQWTPDNQNVSAMVPDAHDPNKRHAPMMFTTDLSLKFEPAYQTIAKRFQENPKEFELAFAKAWFKLTHRDMGPRSRYLGSMAPKEAMIWQDPVPDVDYVLINDNDIAQLKTQILSSGLTGPELIRTAWASASSFRGTDKRGGANGARIRLMPEKDWPANNPIELARVLTGLEKIQNEFNKTQTGGTKVSLADLIILGGTAAVEQAAKEGGHDIKLTFNPGRTDASQDQTDVQAFAVLEPKADGFINYFDNNNKKSPPEMLVKKAKMLNLTIPEMTVLVGGMRALNANFEQTKYGIFTNKPGALTNDYFVNLLDMSTQRKPSTSVPGTYEGFDQKTGQLKWQGTSVDLIFGSNSELRAVAEVYASTGSQDKFVNDFANAWVKVMNLDRFDLAKK